LSNRKLCAHLPRHKKTQLLEGAIEGVTDNGVGISPRIEQFLYRLVILVLRDNAREEEEPSAEQGVDERNVLVFAVFGHSSMAGILTPRLFQILIPAGTLPVTFIVKRTLLVKVLMVLFRWVKLSSRHDFSNDLFCESP
jgi:hypothetical protein